MDAGADVAYQVLTPEAAEVAEAEQSAKLAKLGMQIGNGSASATGTGAEPCHAWHSVRRMKLMQDHQVRALVTEAYQSQARELCLGMFIVTLVVAVHVATAYGLILLKDVLSTCRFALVALFASATVGAQCAFLLQALNHELGHATRALGTSTWLHWGMGWFTFFLCTAGSALCHVPWTAYYFGQGHTNHHMYAGDRFDVDADALFWLWVPPKNARPLTRFMWVSFAAPAVPFAYWASLLYFASLDIKRNIWELRLVTVDLVVSSFVLYYAGLLGALYLLTSSWFSMGMFCHPHLTFWILQHVCCDGDTQPTVSYYGSRMWNALCLNELLHVEHHDIARLGWRHYGKLRKLKPDMYEPLYSQRSILTLMRQWLKADPGPRGMHWDFGCRRTWEYNLPEELRINAARK